MVGTHLQETSSSSSFGFSIWSRRRDPVHSVESTHETNVQETEWEAFQRKVFERFQDLSDANSNDLLSIPWILKLLDSFICCQEEFRIIIFKKGRLSLPSMDKSISDFFDKSVKALDVCNAIRDGIEQIRQWQKQLEIILCALDKQMSIGEGQFRRAKKALVDLAVGMLDEKESNWTLAHRNRSVGRGNTQMKQRLVGHFRSSSWSVSRTWSAARQLQAIGSNLVAPRANEVISTDGLNVAVFTMNYVLLFVMWALVAAIPCQDRGLQTYFTVVRQYSWVIPIHSLHERILEESKKRDSRNACGLLKEIIEIEKCARNMNELTDFVTFPLGEEKENEVRQRVRDLGVVYETIKEGLDPLEHRVREVFHRIVRGRTEGLKSFGRANSHN